MRGLMGQIGWFINTLTTQPTWFFEGDATMKELEGGDILRKAGMATTYEQKVFKPAMQGLFKFHSWTTFLSHLARSAMGRCILFSMRDIHKMCALQK